MTTTGLSTRLRQLHTRPLSAGLAAILMASASLATASDGASNGLAALLDQALIPAFPSNTQLTVSNCDDSGPGSLRDTIENAVSGDTIDLTQLNCSNISLTTGAIVFGQSDLAIQGPGMNELTIDGTLSGAVLYHLGSGTLMVNDVSIAYGFKYRSDVDVLGSCVHSNGNAALTRVHVSTCNTVSASNHAALGGAVWAGGVVQLDHSTITMSEAKASGNGYASGGGVYSLGGFVSVYSTISNNVALSESTTPTFGGGVFTRGGGVLVLSSTVSGNQAARMGGMALADTNGYTANLINSTISGNRADRIGGVFSRPRLNLYNSTIAFNTSHEWTDGPSRYFAAGVYVTVPGEMDSTIVSNNVNDGAPFPTADITGAAGSGFNGGNNNVMLCGLPCPTDTSHEDPGLHPLQDNGGPTRTHVPTPGIWDTFGGTNPLSLLWDQRGPGFLRQSPGDWPEIGALQINSDIIFANGFN